jgi:hypothetical protein
MADGGGVEIERIPGMALFSLIENNVIQANILSGYNCKGSGLSIIGAKATIKNNIISGNYIDVENIGDGGGVYSVFQADTVKLIDNDISDNMIVSEYYARGAGVMCNKPAVEMILIGNTINHNKTFGIQCRGTGAMFRYPAGKVRVLNNEFVGNSGSTDANVYNGGGICLNDAYDSLVIIDGNIFKNDSAIVGGGMYCRRSYNLRITNNVFVENDSENGGGLELYHYASSSRAVMRPQIINNTFHNNYSNFGGGMFLRCELNVPVTFNNIFHDNQANAGNDLYLLDNDDTLLIAYSNIDPGNIAGNSPWTELGNMDTIPGFIDDSCHLTEDSPCRDLGSAYVEYKGTVYYAPDHDFEGHGRPGVYCVDYDIGADEIDWDCTEVDEFNTQYSTLNIQHYPNPTKGSSRFAVRSSRSGNVTLKIYDLHGREVATILDAKLPEGEHVVQYDLSGLPEGVYLVKLQAGGEVASSKIVKVD